MQQSNASTSNHATRHTHSQDTTATHPSGKLVNYKQLACYEHCSGTFGYTFVDHMAVCFKTNHQFNFKSKELFLDDPVHATRQKSSSKKVCFYLQYSYIRIVKFPSICKVLILLKIEYIFILQSTESGSYELINLLVFGF